MSKAQVILVTGANKGIGYAIVRTLLTKAPRGSTIYLTSRNEEAGRKALSSLSSTVNASTLLYHRLDISDKSSINTVFDKIKTAHGTLDVLINNAGVSYDHNGPGLTPETAEEMVEINYYGTLNMCRKFLPIITEETGRIVTISSTVGHLNGFRSDELRREIADPDLTVERLDGLMERYKDDVRSGKAKENGWPNGYSVTKAAQTALTGILAKENPKVLINCCCPGWVDTDMGSQSGKRPPKSIDEGAMIPCRLAVDDIGGVSGKFWENASAFDKGYGEVAVW